MNTPIDRTTKVLLALILLALCALLFKRDATPAYALPASAALPQGVAVANNANNSNIFVVANGYVSLWSADYSGSGKWHLVLLDHKPLPIK